MTTECQVETPPDAPPAERPVQATDRRSGVRAGLPFALATFTLGISFGVLAEPVMGAIAPIVMSATTFAGSAQFAAVSVLGDGGSREERLVERSHRLGAAADYWRLVLRVVGVVGPLDGNCELDA